MLCRCLLLFFITTLVTAYRKCQLDDFLCELEGNTAKLADICIPKEKKCDGYLDCRSGKDELGCPGVACRIDEFRCANGQACIETNQKCDHINNCGDNSDELDCNFPSCHDGQFRCANQFCISMGYRCDGYQDCADRSDELNCTAVACPNNKFLCPKGSSSGTAKCIPEYQLCDGKPDCGDGADEETACSEVSCSTLGCDYKCQASLTGGVCSCPDGKQLSSDNRTCIDRNECQEWGFCDQLCTNTEGSYMCSCAPGYILQDKNKCAALNASSMILFFAHGRNVYRMNPRGEDVKIIANTTGASGLDFHYDKNLLFWSDIKTRKMYSQQLNDPTIGMTMVHELDIIIPDPWLPVALAVDWIGDKLYVVDSIGQKVDVFELTGRWHGIVLGSNLTNPADIALDCLMGYMFVADSSQVLRANMDGTNIHAIVSEAAYKASGITVDIIAKRVYWSDSLLDYIETVDYEGKSRLLVARGQTVPNPSRLALFENQIYWTTDNKQGIMVVDKYESTFSIQVIYRMHNIRNPRALKTVHGLSQPFINSPCGNNNGGCQHMCVITYTISGLGYRCACNVGWRLTSDEHNCDLVDVFLMYSQQKFIKGKVLDPVIEGFSDAMIPVVSQHARFVSLDFDARDQNIYYSEVLQNVIYRVHRNGTSSEIVLALPNNEGVEGLAVDWISKNLYYTDRLKGTLNILSTRNVTYRRTLLKSLKRPRAIVVHPNKGYIFFSEWDQPANISRAYSDGSNLIVFKNVTLGWPNGLAIDFETDRLYWCDALLNHVQHSTLDGTDVKTVNSRLIRHPFSIVIYGKFMYITEWRLNAIIKLDKLTGVQEETIIKEPQTNKLYGVKIYSENEQKVDNFQPCWTNNGGCTKICFAIPRNDSRGLTAKCGCPYGERLMPDLRSCQPDPNHEPPVQACPDAWDFTCNNQRCIPKSWVCDGGNDCLDNSDEEQNCTISTCGSNQFQCKSGRCIPITFRCDAENDCGDFSDETGCVNVTCGSTQFQCESGRCIPNTWKCDSENDCGDGSDEGDLCAEKTCAYNQFTCPSNGDCIPQSFKCDGIPDCKNGSDELGCTYRKCEPDDFHCGSEGNAAKAVDLCISKEKICDGYVDCRSGKDELRCSEIACKLDQFWCANGQRCIELTQKCDHKNDCGDNSDELDCNFPLCHGNQFRCANQLCIPMEYHCDLYQDCADQSDELNCTGFTCPNNKFLCPKGKVSGTAKCIPKSQLCDGKRDCDDSADEVTACSKLSCSTLGCDYKCQASLTGGVCLCPDGKKISSDNRTCIDRNECAEWCFCDQLCANTEGSYMCSCAPGYILQDKNKCAALNASSMILFFAHEKNVYRMNPRGEDIKIIANATGASGLDFHYDKNLLFWSDIKTQKIYSQQLKDTITGLTKVHELDIMLPGLWSPVALAVDWIGDKLYVVDSIGQKVDVFELTGRWHAIVLGSNLTNPVDIALDCLMGYMFVADSSQVLRANMDGTNAYAIVPEATYKASGITIDIIAKRVYWFNSLLHYIETVDYEGQSRFLVVRGQAVLNPSRLALFENRIYWTDGNKQGVMSVDKYERIFSLKSIYRMQDIRDPKALKTVHSLSQPFISNPCGNNNGGCQHMCIITYTISGLGYRCACNTGWKLTSDEHNCDVIDVFLLYSQQRFIKGKVLDPVIEGFSDAMIPVVSQRARFVCLDFDARDQHIYYSDVLQDIIYRVHLNGTSREIVLASKNEGVEGLAVDWISKNLYYIDSREGTLNMLSTRNLTNRTTLLRNLKRPRAIAVHPNKGYIFFSEWSRPANISRAYSDGSNLIVFKNVTLGWPNGLAIDFETDRLYWCDALLNHVQHSTLDGTDVKTVNSKLIRHPFNIVIFGKFMYITDWRLGAIIKLHKLTGEQEETIIKEPQTNRLYGVKIYSGKVQKVDNFQPCWTNNGGCTKICFAVPRNDSSGLTAKCGCPYGERLMPDLRSCQSDPNPEPPVQSLSSSL